MNTDILTIKAQEAVQRAQQIAQEHQHQSIECTHLLQGIIQVDENVFPFILKKLSINQEQVGSSLDQMIAQHPKVSGAESYFSKEAGSALQKAQSS